MEYDVTINRNSYIGGSDIPSIMGISTFKTRYALLLEKAGIEENDFKGNVYTEYGKALEPQIREYINRKRKKKFEPNRTTEGDLRAHTDGFNGDCVLEIKTTSHLFDTVDGYKVYLVQLLFYMALNKVKKGMLAVYSRPDDFNETFDPDRLTVYEIKISDYKDLLDTVFSEIDRFRADLEKLKENPLLSEEDLQPTDVIALSDKVIALENRMAEYKAIEKEYKNMKQALFEAMQDHNIKSWETINGTKITRVDGTEPTVITEMEFDIEKFGSEYPDLVKEYSRPVEKKKAGRSGYVKITLPKA